MTAYRPTIMLSRLVVTKGGNRVFDQRFRPGLNVIRGENGSGKTTVADFIFFGLGGDTPQWRAEAASCDYVYAEVNINGSCVTLRREIEPEKLRPMAVFWDTYDRAQGSNSEWQLYPYAASVTKGSFSQVLFPAAGMPEVKGPLSARVTLHQVLRLVYIDQKTDYEQLFRADPFDSQLTREAVGDLLCGVYDDGLYDAELQLAEKQAKKAALHSELKTIQTLLGDQAIPNVAWLQQEKATLLREREEAYTSLTVLSTGESAPVEAVAARRDQIGGDLATQNQRVHDLQTRIGQASIEKQDRQLFLSALITRLDALQESEATHERLGAFSFQFCPACYAPLSTEVGRCHLCKAKSEPRPGQNILHLRHTLEQQIRESEILQKQLDEELTKALTELGPAKDRQQRLQLEYDEISTAPYAAKDAAAAGLHRRIGYIDRSIEDLEQRSRLAARISAIIEMQAGLAADISKLTEEIETRRAVQELTKQEVYRLISELTVDLLKRDLPREAAFANASHVDFDFGTNRISVDGRGTFAASSNVYLKNVFHLAFLHASTLKEYMRYPRLAIFDNVEDKGMEPTRSHNFQRLVREMSRSAEVEHQVILLTSMVAPEFESDPSILVGPPYTHDFKTLQFSSAEGTD